MTCIEVLTTVSKYAFGDSLCDDTAYKKLLRLAREGDTANMSAEKKTQILLNFLFTARAAMRECEQKAGQNSWYSSTFKKAAEYECDRDKMLEKNVMSSLPYDNDGIKYTIGEDNVITRLVPYNGSVAIEPDRKIEQQNFAYNFNKAGRGEYYKLRGGCYYKLSNELDHVLTFCINRIILSLTNENAAAETPTFRVSDYGMRLIVLEAVLGNKWEGTDVV